MLSQQLKNQILNAIGRIPEFNNFGVAYIGSGSCEVLRSPVMPDGYQTWIVLKEEENSDGATVPTGASSSSVGSELLNMGLSCGSAILAGAAGTVAAGAAPVTAGTSVAITFLSYTAAAASAAQCGISTGRVFNAIFAPDNNAILDSNEWMRNTGYALDAIAVGGGVAGLGQAARAALRLSSSSGGGRSIYQVLRSMSRAERKRVAEDIARYSGQAATRRQFIRLVRAGKFPRIFTQAQITQAVISHLLDSISSVLTFGGSTYSGVISIYFAEE